MQPESSQFSPFWPYQNTLAVVTLPQTAVALISGGEDMGRQLTQAVLPVQLYSIHTVQTRDGPVGVHWCQDGANVGLRGENKTQQGNEAPETNKQTQKSLRLKEGQGTLSRLHPRILSAGGLDGFKQLLNKERT